MTVISAAPAAGARKAARAAATPYRAVFMGFPLVFALMYRQRIVTGGDPVLSTIDVNQQGMIVAQLFL
jgi:hypothetical protein